MGLAVGLTAGSGYGTPGAEAASGHIPSRGPPWGPGERSPSRFSRRPVRSHLSVAPAFCYWGKRNSCVANMERVDGRRASSTRQ